MRAARTQRRATMTRVHVLTMVLVRHSIATAYAVAMRCSMPVVCATVRERFTIVVVKTSLKALAIVTATCWMNAAFVGATASLKVLATATAMCWTAMVFVGAEPFWMIAEFAEATTVPAQLV